MCVCVCVCPCKICSLLHPWVHVSMLLLGLATSTSCVLRAPGGLRLRLDDILTGAAFTAGPREEEEEAGETNFFPEGEPTQLHSP